MDLTISQQVAAIIEEIKKNGDSAVIKYVKKFDGLSFASVKQTLIGKKQTDFAAKNIENNLKKSIQASFKNVQAFHKKEYSNIKKQWFISDKVKTIGQTYNPVESVGIYVPGGKFSYPSSVLMNAIPAKVAGVKRIVMITPPKKMTNEVLYAASLCGINEIYSIGGPVAVAALAYGTKTIKPVDMIVGPGNAYVNEAKRLVFGKVGIDSLAGPSEVAIIADAGANIDYIYYDIMAQVEHDSMAKAYLFCTSNETAKKVKNMIDKQYLKQIIIKNTDIEEACGLVNKIAPEHLELLVKDAKKIVKYIKNAGAVFVGYKTPTVVGDYWAGPSHVLPTNGAARYSSGLSVMTFLKRTSYIELKDAGKNIISSISAFAGTEGLVNHKKSIEVRYKK